MSGAQAEIFMSCAPSRGPCGDGSGSMERVQIAEEADDSAFPKFTGGMGFVGSSYFGRQSDFRLSLDELRDWCI